MNRFGPHALSFLLLAWISTACTSNRASGQPPATGGTGGSAHTDHRVQNGNAEEKEGSTPSGGSNHHFEPRPHQAHYTPPIAPTPALGTLPRFVDGSSQCFYQPEREYRPYPHPRPYPAPYGSSATRGSVKKGIARSAPKPKPTSRPALRPPRAADSASGSADAAPRATSPPPPAREQAAPGVRALRGPGTQGSGARGGNRAPSGAFDGAAANNDSWSPPFDPGEPPVQHESGYGASIYLSNDDTMSLSSAQRLIYAIDQYAPVTPEQVRPHELLNYFSFQTAPVRRDHDFSVVPSIAPSSEDPELWSLGFAIQGRPLTTHTRRNANLSFVIDRSGSMSSDGRMDYVKRGMQRSLQELKAGDIVNITLFDSNVCQLAENFVVGRDSMSQLSQLINRIQPRGSTNLYDGLNQGYQAADRVYRQEYTNRVVMITDANTNTGVTNERMIALVGKHYDSRRIRLSGVGVGRDFNDSLLDRLTERGKGAYVFLGSDAEVEAVFGPRFVSLIETIANDVHFKLHLPPSLKMDTFYGEEASTVKERVQAIHYFANTSQMFLSDLRSKDGTFPGSDDVMLTIEYEDPESGKKRVEEFSWQLADITANRGNIDKALLVSTFARRLEKLAARPLPSQWSRHAHTWVDADALRTCDATRQDLQRLSRSVSGDPEVSRVQGLWDSYCDRYQPVQIARRDPVRREELRPERPLRNNEFAPRDTWPSAVR